MFIKLLKLCKKICVRQTSTSTGFFRKQPVIGIRQENISLWERRAPLGPTDVAKVVSQGVKVVIQPSHRRAYSLQEYKEAGATVSENIHESDVILGKW